jgi:hypothetical protein
VAATTNDVASPVRHYDDAESENDATGLVPDSLYQKYWTSITTVSLVTTFCNDHHNENGCCRSLLLVPLCIVVVVAFVAFVF